MCEDARQRKVVLVSGAGQRVGKAIAQALAQAGMRVVLHYHRSASGAQALCDAIDAAGGDARPLSADLRQPAAARALVDEAARIWGRLDGLVLSAACFPRVPLAQVDDEAWQEVMSLNLDAPYRMALQAAPYLRQQRGHIVCITGFSTQIPYRHYLPYIVSKGGLRQLMRVLSLELAPEVRVNAVAPGTVLPPPDMSPAEVQALADAVPLKRIGRPEDVAAAVVYLAQADYVTGQELFVDGGVSVAGRS
ncbi:MAG: SDR family NAD(P)-dependent oxidoreductase [Polyangiales bacterium]